MSIFKPYQYKDKADLKKDAPAKHPVVVFFEIYFRKFWRLTTVNIIYFLICLPLLINFYFMINGAFATEAIGDLLPGLGIFAAIITVLPESVLAPVYYVLLIISAILYGPVKMGVTYVYRNFARQEHAWISDVFARAKSNLKQGLFFGILDIAVVYLVIRNLSMNLQSADSSMETLLVVGQVVSVVMLVIYTFMRHYTYMMAVTVELNVFQILKNSALFAISGLGWNVLTTLICMVLWIIALFIFPMVALILLPLFIYSLCGFITAYACYPLVHKHLVAPALEKENAQN